jgi:hypothetical protein
LAAGLSGLSRALPVAAEINRRSASHRQANHAIHLLAVTDAAQIFAPCRLLGVTNKIRSGDMMMMPEFAAAQTGEKGFRAVGAGAVFTMGLSGNS